MIPEGLRQQVEGVARDVAAYIAYERSRFDQRKVEYKGSNDLVSYVDREAEKQLVKALSDLLPEAGILAEEGTSAQTDSELTWVIDPLDGTTNFLHNLPHYSVSIALLQGSKPVLGVVYDVVRQESFSAQEGKGAYLNGLPIEVDPESSLSKALVASGMPYADSQDISKFMALLEHIIRHTHGIRRQGSAALDMAYVAAGRLQAYFESSIKPWDIAAGGIIVREAGGQVSDFQLSPDFVFSGNIIAAGPCFDELSKLIQHRWRQ